MVYRDREEDELFLQSFSLLINCDSLFLLQLQNSSVYNNKGYSIFIDFGFDYLLSKVQN